MRQYHELCKHILENGRHRVDRTGTGTVGVFGWDLRFNLQEGFPLLTTKKLHLRSIIHELLWFLSGSTNIKYLKDNGVSIWDEWADENGELGPGVYGAMWRHWPDVRVIDFEEKEAYASKGFNVVDDLFCRGDVGLQQVVSREIDQFQNVIDTLRKNPDSRRIIVSAWNPALVDETALPPCHSFFQFSTEELTQKEIVEWVCVNKFSEYSKIQDILKKEIKDGKFRDPNAEPGLISRFTTEALIARNRELFAELEGVPKRRLSCKLTMRSVDVGLGMPFNIASYSLLTMMVAQCVDMIPGDFILSSGDTHIYKNHIEQIKEQISRQCRALPKMLINPSVHEITDFKYEDFTLEGYDPHPHIKMEVSV